MNNCEDRLAQEMHEINVKKTMEREDKRSKEEWEKKWEERKKEMRKIKVPKKINGRYTIFYY